MYSEAKLAFYIYLWYPKTKGTAYVYDSFFRPYISKHETDIDRNLSELRTMAGDMAVSYWQRAASYIQTRTFDISQYVASQSTPKPRTPQSKQPARARQPAPNHKEKIAAQQETKEQPAPAATFWLKCFLWQPPRVWMKKIQDEWKILEKDLPGTIFVRVYEQRMDLLRAVIIGPAGNPYHDGLFVFDIHFPPTYPSVPPASPTLAAAKHLDNREGVLIS